MGTNQISRAEFGHWLRNEMHLDPRAIAGIQITAGTISDPVYATITEYRTDSDGHRYIDYGGDQRRANQMAPLLYEAWAARGAEYHWSEIGIDGRERWARVARTALHETGLALKPAVVERALPLARWGLSIATWSRVASAAGQIAAETAAETYRRAAAG